MRSDTKHKAKCGTQSYYYCRENCLLRDDCRYLKGMKIDKEDSMEDVQPRIGIEQLSDRTWKASSIENSNVYVIKEELYEAIKELKKLL